MAVTHHNRLVPVFCILVIAAANAVAAQRVLRVCADPNNLPFSNQQQQGFENRIADLLARDLGAVVEYTWWSMRRGFVRNALNAGVCDVIMAMPAESEMVLATRPYYKSTYVFASRKDDDLKLTSLNDSRFAEWRVGVQLAGNDFVPPAHALAARGITGTLIPFSLYGAEGEANPQAKIMEAVARGDVDVAIVWGPFAGYFAKKIGTPLEIVPVSPSSWRSMPFTFSIAAAVRKGDAELRDQLDGALQHQCTAIQAILSEYGLPQPADGRTECANSH